MRAVVALLAILLLVPGKGEAQEANFRVRVLLASKQAKWVDPKIPGKLQDYLAQSFGARYSHFKLLDTQTLKVDLKGTGEVSLPDKTLLKLSYRAVEGQFIKLTMEIKDLKTTIRIRDGGMFFQAGYAYRNGMLILAISASTGSLEDDAMAKPRPEPRSGETVDPAGEQPPRSIEGRGQQRPVLPDAARPKTQ